MKSRSPRRRSRSPRRSPRKNAYKPTFIDNVEATRFLLQSRFASLYTDQEKQQILAVSSARHLPPSPWYDPSLPTLPYRVNKGQTAARLVNLHHGQRKLFIAELEGLLHLLNSAIPTGQPIVIVYAGSAPGIHIPYLAQLFPTTVWHLIDPAPFHMRGSAHVMQRIHVERAFFTDETALAWRDRCDIFISDIRLDAPADAPDAQQLKETGWSATFERQVAEDMARQDRWTTTIRPRIGASLKWRPPYVESDQPVPPINSVRGRVLIQTWAPCGSTEGRLLVSGEDARNNVRMSFDPLHYQNACFQRNHVLRPWATYATTGRVSGVPGFDSCYDCVREAEAWQTYLTMVKAESPFVERKPGKIGEKMNDLTQSIHQFLDGHLVHGTHPHFPAAVRLMMALST